MCGMTRYLMSISATEAVLSLQWILSQLNDTATTKMVNLLHAVWNVTHLKTKPYSAWQMSITPSSGTTACTPLSDAGSNLTLQWSSMENSCLSADYKLVRNSVSWLLLLWFDCEDDAPGYIILSGGGYSDNLTVARHV